jgi:hypothetical protein
MFSIESFDERRSYAESLRNGPTEGRDGPGRRPSRAALGAATLRVTDIPAVQISEGSVPHISLRSCGLRRCRRACCQRGTWPTEANDGAADRGGIN